jgi:hypothetical protein
VDLQGNAYVTGTTIVTDFPTTENAFARILGGLSDAFVTELNAKGDRLLYSTYLGVTALILAMGSHKTIEAMFM